MRSHLQSPSSVHQLQTQPVLLTVFRVQNKGLLPRTVLHIPPPRAYDLQPQETLVVTIPCTQRTALVGLGLWVQNFFNAPAQMIPHQAQSDPGHRHFGVIVLGDPQAQRHGIGPHRLALSVLTVLNRARLGERRRAWGRLVKRMGMACERSHARQGQTTKPAQTHSKMRSKMRWSVHSRTQLQTQRQASGCTAFNFSTPQR